MSKRILDILLTLAAAFTISGCGDALRTDGAGERPSGLTFSVSVPEAGAAMGTKSFTGELISSLWVLVFDDQGFYVESQKAEAVNPASFSTDENTEYQFHVNLQSSLTRRTLHLVANYDFDKNPVSYGTEYSVLRSLTVSGEQDAYWQKVELTDGIRSQEELDKMTADELNAYYEASGLKKIPLVRNFAKVHVESTATNFTLEGYALWNVPDRGCVAPCVMSQNDFAVYATSGSTSSLPNNPWVSRSYDELKASYDGTSTDGFLGYLPQGAQIIKTDASALSFSTADEYMYERPYSEDVTNTAIIVKGKFGTNASSYYKIDFVQTADAGMMTYYNILRNFIYTATIISCTANGYDTPAEAAAAPASNNFVSSVVTKDIVNISDGTSRLNISYTDTTVVSANDFTFRYQYIPDISAPTVVDNTKITTYDKATGAAMAPGGDVIKSWTSADVDSWRVVTITPQTPSDEEKTQTVIFYEPKTGTNVKIARTVTYHLRNPFKMTIECVPATVSSTIGQQLTLNIKVPTGLASHLFPLEFKMEAEANSLTPDVSKAEDTYKSGYMSTWYGTSITSSGKQTFGFSKTVTYAEYLAMATTSDNSCKIIPCAFKTTKANSATTVWVQNKYFEFGSGISTVEFTN
jgi:hypothetical protein